MQIQSQSLYKSERCSRIVFCLHTVEGTSVHILNCINSTICLIFPHHRVLRLIALESLLIGIICVKIEMTLTIVNVAPFAGISAKALLELIDGDLWRSISITKFTTPRCRLDFIEKKTNNWRLKSKANFLHITPKIC